MNNKSEWNLDIVTVTDTYELPKANNLIGVKVSGVDIPLVARKSDIVVGNKYVLVGIDTLVDTTSEYWKFLAPKAPASGWYRIRPQRWVNGLYPSHGVLMPVPQGCEKASQEELCKVLHCTKFLNPDESDTVQTPAKKPGIIDWLIKKFTKKPGLSRIPDYEVYNVKKTGFDIFEGHKVLLTEKLHGTNVRFGKVNGRFVVGSHHTWKYVGPGWLGRLFRKKGSVKDSWYKEDLYYSTVVDNVDLNFLENNVIYYGEIIGKTKSGKNIQDMTYGFDKPVLKVFPVKYHVDTKSWSIDVGSTMCVPREGVFNTVEALEMEVKSLAECDSAFGGIKEGIVMHSITQPGVSAKYVSNRYHERKV